MQRKLKIILLFLSSLVIVIFAATTFIRNAVWQSEIALWEDAVEKSPNKGRTHHNLGRAYDTNRRPRNAFEQYLIATSVEPGLAKAHESLGISYVSQGQTDLARQQFAIALQLDPDLRDAQMFFIYISRQNNNSPH
jgi:protein O-mannosyl-transferase